MRSLLRLRRWRLKKGWSQAKLSEKSGIPQGALSNMEAGHKDITLSTLTALAQALELSPAELLSDPTRDKILQDRYTRDRIAISIVSGKPLRNFQEEAVAQAISRLVSQKIRAFEAPGKVRSRRDRMASFRYSEKIRDQYSDEIIRDILNRVDKHLGGFI
jgi:transcriptional regulator with XRE-family HTH domain